MRPLQWLTDFSFCSSIGIAKAALEAVNGENLFGKQGASWSVVFVDYDAHNRNRTIFEGILPRESNSKVGHSHGLLGYKQGLFTWFHNN